MHFLNNEFKMVAKTIFGLEEVLAAELLRLGAKSIEIHNRAVSFVGDIGFLYKSNLCLRTAMKILVPFETFSIESAEDLYSSIKKIKWENFFTENESFAINSVVSSDIFNHSNFPTLKAKDAIVDRFREMGGTRPNVDTENPDLRINIHITGQEVIVSLDSSGDSLHKRGYRDKTNLAPINEVLAAGLVLLSGWEYHQPLIDGMCGSGTILIEAALHANNIPPGYYRSSYAFQKWKNYDESLWNLIYDSTLSKIKDREVAIYGCEISRNVQRKAVENIHLAKVEDVIEIKTISFQEFDPPQRRGVVIMNPPYGERMDKEEDIMALYKSIGDTLKLKYEGYDAWVISSNINALKHIGLRPSRKITVFNGPLECKFMKFEMYRGTKKIHKLV